MRKNDNLGYAPHQHTLHEHQGITHDKKVYQQIGSYLEQNDAWNKLIDLQKKIGIGIKNLYEYKDIKEYIQKFVPDCKELLGIDDQQSLSSQLKVDLWSDGLLDRLISKEIGFYIDKSGPTQGGYIIGQETVITNVLIFLILESELKGKNKEKTFASKKITEKVVDCVKFLVDLFTVPRVDEEIGVDKRAKDDIMLEGGGMYDDFMKAARDEKERTRIN